MLGYTTSGDHNLVCKYLFSSPTNLGWQQTILYRGPYGATLLPSGDIFLPGYDSNAPVNIHFYKLKSFWYNWNNINLNKNGRSTLLTSLLIGVSGEPDKVVRALDDLFNYLRDKAPGTNLLNSLLA